ncbi:MAG: hypothetical protein AB1422_13790 [bacterium]
MNTFSNIGYTNYYLPKTKIKIEEIVSKIASSANEYDHIKESIQLRIGTEFIYKEKRENEYNIYKDLLTEYLNKKSIDANSIDYLFYTNTMEANEDIVYALHQEFKFVNANIMSIAQGCSGVLASIKVADALIKNNTAKNILILANSFLEDDRKRYLAPAIISDGLGIMEVTEKKGEFEIIDYCAFTNGSINENTFKTEGTPVRVIKNGSNLILKLLKNNNHGINDISRILPVNTNIEAYEYYSNFLNCEIGKIFLDNIPKGGHFGNVDAIRNITDTLNSNIYKKDDLIVLYAVSIGTQWSAILLKKT